MNQNVLTKNLNHRTARAVAVYWVTRSAQRQRQEKSGKADQGLRSAVTGGKQMDGLIDLFSELVIQAGIPTDCIFRNKPVQLPGFFRPTKEWDLLIVHEQTLSGSRFPEPAFTRFSITEKEHRSCQE